MTNALACSSESSVSSNPLQNQQGTLGYLVFQTIWSGGTEPTYKDGQFLIALNIPDYDAE